MSAKSRVNYSLYRENSRPRQLRGYLAFCGLQGALDRLADEVTTRRAQSAFESIVPAEISGACEVLLFRDGELCIFARQGAWANWLRNRHTRLMDGFTGHGIRLSRLTVVVAPHNAVDHTRAVEKPLPPSADAGRLLRQRAVDTTSPRLKSALERLATRLDQYLADSK